MVLLITVQKTFCFDEMNTFIYYEKEHIRMISEGSWWSMMLNIQLCVTTINYTLKLILCY